MTTDTEILRMELVTGLSFTRAERKNPELIAQAYGEAFDIIRELARIESSATAQDLGEAVLGVVVREAGGAAGSLPVKTGALRESYRKKMVAYKKTRDGGLAFILSHIPYAKAQEHGAWHEERDYRRPAGYNLRKAGNRVLKSRANRGKLANQLTKRILRRLREDKGLIKRRSKTRRALI